MGGVVAPTATRELAERLRSAGRNWRRAVEGESNVKDGGDIEHVNKRVWGPCQANTGDGQQWRSQHNGKNDDALEEGGSHPTPPTMATHELAARLCSAGVPYASEPSLSDVDDANGQQQRRERDHPMMMKRGVMSANYGLSRRF